MDKYDKMTGDELEIMVAELLGYRCKEFKSKYAFMKDLKFVVTSPEGVRCSLGVTASEAWRDAAKSGALGNWCEETGKALSLFDKLHQVEIILNARSVTVYCGQLMGESYKAEVLINDGDKDKVTARALTIAYLRWYNTEVITSG